MNCPICIYTNSVFGLQTRKDAVVAEVKWFYRVSELPESVYCLLMDDRKEGADVCTAANLFAIKL